MKRCAYCGLPFEGRGKTCSDGCARARQRQMKRNRWRERFRLDPKFRSRERERWRQDRRLTGSKPMADLFS